MLSNYPTISIIIPCRNEENFIAKCITSILNFDYPEDKIEILIADGRSNDKTKEILYDYQKNYGNIKILDNPEQSVPYALNYCIKQSSGELIIRIDAHSFYPKEYLEALIGQLNLLGADNIGGRCIIKPAGQSRVKKIIALTNSHPFGIGDASWRMTSRKEPFLTDTVPFGCFKREVFDKIGLFDEDLIRNQDDEFNARMIKNGMKVYLIPTLEITYFARDSFVKMARMFYQYGYFKPLVGLKIGKPATLRQLVPPLFVLFLVVGSLFAFMFNILAWFYFFGLFLYFSVSAVTSWKLDHSNNKSSILETILTMYAFLLIHTSYGCGYLLGLFDFIILKKHAKKKISLATNR